MLCPLTEAKVIQSCARSIKSSIHELSWPQSGIMKSKPETLSSICNSGKVSSEQVSNCSKHSSIHDSIPHNRAVLMLAAKHCQIMCNSAQLVIHLAAATWGAQN